MIASTRISLRLIYIDNHILSLRKLADHIVADNGAKTVLIDMQYMHDAGRFDVNLLRDLLRQLTQSALSKVNRTVVIGLPVGARETDIETRDFDMVSRRHRTNQLMVECAYWIWVDTPRAGDRSGQYQRS